MAQKGVRLESRHVPQRTADFGNKSRPPSTCTQCSLRGRIMLRSASSTLPHPGYYDRPMIMLGRAIPGYYYRPMIVLGRAILISTVHRTWQFAGCAPRACASHSACVRAFFFLPAPCTGTNHEPPGRRRSRHRGGAGSPHEQQQERQGPAAGVRADVKRWALIAWGGERRRQQPPLPSRMTREHPSSPKPQQHRNAGRGVSESPTVCSARATHLPACRDAVRRAVPHTSRDSLTQSRTPI